MSTRIITVSNIKGGVSKTSAGLFLAAALSINDKRKVLYLDCDSQASAYEYRQFEKQHIYPDTPEPYRIRRTDPADIFDVIQDNWDNYDIIFIDMPRLTRKEDDQKVAMMITLCDSVLIPVKSGELDNMSTDHFVKLVRTIAEKKASKNKAFQFAAFASMTGQRPTEDAAAKEFVNGLDIPLLQQEMRNVKEFTRSYTYESLLNIGKSERERFKPFYDEVKQFFDL